MFTRHLALIKCSLSRTDLNARTKAELKIAMEDKLSTANGGFVLILNTKQAEKRASLPADWLRSFSSGESQRDQGHAERKR